MLKTLLRKALHRRGFELVRGPTTVDFLSSRGVDLVLDVGANTGQYARILRDQGYRGRIRSFEPVAAVHAELARAAASDPLWTAERTAVGAATGIATINVARHSVYSSILATTGRAAVFDANSRTVATETVPLATVDALTAAETARSIFLKIDTQGFERDVLEGAKALLPRCVGLELELPVEHLYEGVWSLREALAYVDAAGFAPAQIRPVGPLDGDPASAMEFDWVFRRR